MNKKTSAEVPTTLTVSGYDKVASGLIALLIMSATVTGTLLLIWWGSSLRYQRIEYKLSLADGESGRGSHPKGIGFDEKSPGDPELPKLEEPAGTELFDQLTPTSALAYVEQAAVGTIAEIGDLAAMTSSTPGFLHGRGGGGGGPGDKRRLGPIDIDGPFVIPRQDRWEFQFTSSNVDAYAAQLDSFGIELGAIGGKPDIDYAFHLTQSTPDRRSGPSQQEKRLYMAWKQGSLQRFDRLLLSRAGIETDGRFVVQFYPKDVENTLEALEQRHAGGRPKREFLKTVFGVRSQRGILEFFVVQQTFRTLPLE